MSFKEYKDGVVFDKPDKITAEQYRLDVVTKMSLKLIDYFQSKNQTVDNDLSDLIHNMFYYILIKRRQSIEKDIKYINEHPESTESTINHYISNSWSFIRDDIRFKSRKDYLRWAHEKMSNGYTRNEMIIYMCNLALKNKGIFEVIKKLRDVRDYLN